MNNHKVCSGCKLPRRRDKYSSTQYLKKKAKERKCNECLQRKNLSSSLRKCQSCEIKKPDKYFSPRNKKECLFCTIDLNCFSKKNCTKTHLKDLIKWVQSNGGRVKNASLESKDDSNQRCLTTTKIHPAKSEIMFIPENCVLRTKQANSSQTDLALLLLEEKTPDSHFWPFIQSLPTDYSHVPLYFSKEKKLRLKGTLNFDMLHSKFFQLLEDYRSLPNPTPCTFVDFVWARTAVITRVFKCDFDDIDQDCLVPLADMMNHSNSPNVTWGNDQDGFFMVSNKIIMSKQELTDNYGSKCNTRYFVNYGFVLQDNQNFNQTSLFFDATKDFDQKTFGPPQCISDGYAQTQCLGKYRFQVSRLFPGLPTIRGKNNVYLCVKAMFSFARMCFGGFEDGESNKNDDGTMPLTQYTCGFTSEENERKAVAFIEQACLNRQTSDLYENEVLQFYVDLASKIKNVPEGKLYSFLRQDKSYRHVM